jgi:hypothetical protein
MKHLRISHRLVGGSSQLSVLRGLFEFTVFFHSSIDCMGFPGDLTPVVARAAVYVLGGYLVLDQADSQ